MQFMIISANHVVAVQHIKSAISGTLPVNGVKKTDWQFCKQQRLIDERGQRRMTRVVWADREGDNYGNLNNKHGKKKRN